MGYLMLKQRQSNKIYVRSVNELVCTKLEQINSEIAKKGEVWRKLIIEKIKHH